VPFGGIVPLSWAVQIGGAHLPPGRAGNPAKTAQAKRHYRKKCPVFILAIGFIRLGLSAPLRHNERRRGVREMSLPEPGIFTVRPWWFLMRHLIKGKIRCWPHRQHHHT
jgi:hypothetical protein